MYLSSLAISINRFDQITWNTSSHFKVNIQISHFTLKTLSQSIRNSTSSKQIYIKKTRLKYVQMFHLKPSSDLQGWWWSTSRIFFWEFYNDLPYSWICFRNSKTILKNVKVNGKDYPIYYYGK
jgi:hypothetical protein